VAFFPIMQHQIIIFGDHNAETFPEFGLGYKSGAKEITVKK